MTTVFAAGGYRYMPAIFQYSGGVAAEPDRRRLTDVAVPEQRGDRIRKRCLRRASVGSG